ncbi:MAG: 4a-hydroxytetrahydrobiopterin dehydratase [Planctomycetota bacterium]
MSQSLTAATCKPCEGGVDPLTPDEAADLLTKLDGWHLSADAKLISKSWTRADFMDAIGFCVRVAGVAEADGHHPDVHLTNYRDLTIDLTTHAIDGLSENDFIVAAKIDALEK